MQSVHPSVSVIIPVYNDSARLKTCLLALENQTYPQTLFEIIVVDNNSSEDISTITSDFGHVKLVSETQKGSYAARNKGISVASSEIFAFTDSDCLPCPEWIEQGVKKLKDASADLVGGRITFQFSSQKTSSEIYDSITALQVQKNIETRQLTVTANLLTYRYVFDSIGLFDSSLQSGGDFRWTKKATDSGFCLVYSSDAEILHPARNFKSLVKKGFRVGSGQFQLLQDQQITPFFIVLKSLRDIFPPSPWGYWNFVCQSGNDDARQRFLDMWLIAWVCNIATSFGRLKSILKK